MNTTSVLINLIKSVITGVTMQRCGSGGRIFRSIKRGANREPPSFTNFIRQTVLHGKLNCRSWHQRSREDKDGLKNPRQHCCQNSSGNYADSMVRWECRMALREKSASYKILSNFVAEVLAKPLRESAFMRWLFLFWYSPPVQWLCMHAWGMRGWRLHVITRKIQMISPIVISFVHENNWYFDWAEISSVRDWSLWIITKRIAEKTAWKPCFKPYTSHDCKGRKTHHGYWRMAGKRSWCLYKGRNTDVPAHWWLEQNKR